jgi:hypothetical protein
MTKRKNVSSPANGSTLFIPLNKLKKSPRNARKTPHPEADIESLAASIGAHGMLQSPVVEPEIKDGKPTGSFLVTIGEGRRQAQLLRVKRKEIAKTDPSTSLPTTPARSLSARTRTAKPVAQSCAICSTRTARDISPTPNSCSASPPPSWKPSPPR